MDYKTALEFIHGRPRLRKEPTVKRMTAFLDQLGNPQDAIQGIHVAGTNGKGSTIAFLANDGGYWTTSRDIYFALFRTLQ